MKRRLTPSVATLVATALLVAACTGGDSAEGPSAQPTSSSSDPNDALEPIAPVPPIEVPTTTAAPTPTEPVPQLPERMANPNPQWAPVDVASGEPLMPATLQQLIVDPASEAYDISPDGRHVARTDPTEGLCLSSTVDPSTEVCNDSIEVSFVTWAPGSSMVLFNFVSWTQGRSGPLGTFGIDGTVTELVEPIEPDEPIGGADSAGFVDADTVLYSRLIFEPGWKLEVHTVGIDGSDRQLLGSLDLGSPPNLFITGIGVVDGTSLYIQATTPAGGGNGIWRYDAERDAFGRIVEYRDSADGTELVESSPVAVRGGLLLSVENERLAAFTSNREDARFFDLTTTDGATSVSIDDLDDDYMILSAALSPDGAHVAVYEFYRGDDGATADSAAVGRASIATTASLLAGEPVWFTITDVGPGAPGRNLDRSGTTITWPTTDRLYVELLDDAYAIDVVPA